MTRAMRAELADDLAQLGRPIAANGRASCCPALDQRVTVAGQIVDDIRR